MNSQANIPSLFCVTIRLSLLYFQWTMSTKSLKGKKFEISQYLSPIERKQIAKTLQLSERQVRVKQIRYQYYSSL